ncbi:hypothetical protein DAPPUDRAFT_233553 [Daphnia pulex]|uniref:Uncharacterized protein n=1 Tax=Daphnia pulex TaxID=6669 RepID=E9FV41_DAPPU|nr:hypothetical protein DAPPUDRAFT_233553 [Daphnia pulex]|eukprot:EFX89174.1 hypothetical protein DAPPUDRAFT_233553 [Daphnia pulex]
MVDYRQGHFIVVLESEELRTNSGVDHYLNAFVWAISGKKQTHASGGLAEA